jgi:SAM-dependent methyltransferase
MGTMETEEAVIRNAVREHYAQLARSTNQLNSCCAPSSSDGVDGPEEARTIYAGCGAPVEAADIKDGEIIVDLGSGGGFDVFNAARRVGSSGRVIGVDATPEMIWRARETARKHAISNVEFRLGEIEHLPVEKDYADLVMSNCVINLAPDKARVFREAYRILKPGGRFAISDIVVRSGAKVDPADLGRWVECEAGAINQDEYIRLVREAGFVNTEVRDESGCCSDQATKSITITGLKPAPDSTWLPAGFSGTGPSRSELLYP